MKYKNLFDCLENAEDRDMEKITRNAPQLDDEQLERILSMSERKYNIKKTKNINMEYTDGYGSDAVAEGVETYDKRPIWLRYAATAAALVLTVGLVALSHNLLGRRHGNTEAPSLPNIAASSSVTTTGTTDINNTDITTVSADYSAEETGTVSADTAENTAVSETTAQAAAASPTETASPQQEDSTASPNALTEAQCIEVIDKRNEDYIRYTEIVQVPIREYLDFSDTFTVTYHLTTDYYSDGQPYADGPKLFEVQFVHYVDPSFSSINDIRNFYDDYNMRWSGGRNPYSDKMFGQTIVPDQYLSCDKYDEQAIFVYTEYNGKIYRGIDSRLTSEDTVTQEQHRTSERQALSWGEDHFRNITDTSFECYRTQLDRWDGTYYGVYRYYYNDGTGWRTDDSKERELSDAECRAIMNE